jgi:SAM-dependent methyltransferase
MLPNASQVIAGKGDTEFVMETQLTPADLNGDLDLSREDRRAYMRFHADRNRTTAIESLGIRTLPPAAWGASAPAGCTPSRVSMLTFFEWAARELRSHFRDRHITIVDIGCGTGRTLDPFAALGYRGTYIGLDIARHPKWKDGPQGGFTRQLIVGDVQAMSLAALPPIDILLSATALEHIRDDAGAVARLSARLAPGAAQAHFVPGEAALPLYGPHGWRQYSPHCLRGLFPAGDIYRFGGRWSNALHARAVTAPTNRGELAMGERRPRLYSLLRSAAMLADRACGNRPAAMYGVLCRSGLSQTSGATQHAPRGAVGDVA